MSKVCMVRLILFFLICVNCAQAQEHSFLFQAKSIKENNVFKVLEYDPEDSVGFFEKYPEGYYSKYDRNGRMNESNYYSYEYNDGWHVTYMIKNFYLYDSVDNQVAVVQIADELESPIQYMSVASFGTSDTIQFAYLKRGNKLIPEVIFDIKLKERKSSYWRDTVKVSKRHYFLQSLKDSTITMDIYYNKDRLKDSVIFRSPGSGSMGIYRSEKIITYSYYPNGIIKTIKEESYQITKTRVLSAIKEYYFLENELLDRLRSYYPKESPQWTERKFKYFLRKT